MSPMTNVGQTILNSIRDLNHANKPATRQAIREVTGYKLTIVDDHVKRLKAKEKIRAVVPGVFEWIEPAREDRAPSLTILPSNEIKVEIGEQMLDLNMREARVLGMMLAGFALQFGAVGSAPQGLAA